MQHRANTRADIAKNDKDIPTIPSIPSEGDKMIMKDYQVKLNEDIIEKYRPGVVTTTQVNNAKYILDIVLSGTMYGMTKVKDKE